ncbi:MAG: biotin/lipoyl-binding protein, partial [Variovorax sp.]
MTHVQALTPGGMAPPRETTEQQIRRLVSVGLWTVMVIVVPLGVWIGLAPLAMAVVAPAHVKVDLNRRPVQHLEGGIVRQVLVRDGQKVKEGEPLLVIGDVGVDADRNRLSYRLAVERTSQERLDAEQRRAPSLVFSAGLQAEARRDPRLQDAMAKEAALFAARQHSLNSELALMKQLRQRVQQEIGALEAQGVKAQESLALQRRELESNRGLVEEGFVSVARIN